MRPLLGLLIDRDYSEKVDSGYEIKPISWEFRMRGETEEEQWWIDKVAVKEVSPRGGIKTNGLPT